MVSDRLTIPATVAEELLAHARSELPNEACGLLAGDLATGIGDRIPSGAQRRGQPAALRRPPR